MADAYFWPSVSAISAIALVWFISQSRKNRSTNIPGPRGWPIVGYMPHLSPHKLYDTMKQLIDDYGPIFKLKLGSWNTVVIADYELIRKAFNEHDFSFRPKLFFVEFTSQGGYGLTGSNGQLWQEQRRFALRHLRDLGMGRSSIESHIQREALAVTEDLKKTMGQPIDLSFNLNIAITNIVWAIVAGKRMEYDDPTFLGFMEANNRNFQLSTRMGIIGFIPWLKTLLPESWLGLNFLKETRGQIIDYIKDLIKEHKENFDPNDLRDYIDHFLAEQARQGEDSTFSDLQLITSVANLFVAGGETTSTTLRWAVLLLAYHPEVQRRMQEEIDRVIGAERLPTLNDREQMPYTDAVIHEVQRFGDIAPMGVFHTNRNDVDFGGYIIPKDTLVMGYAGECHRSSKFWSHPDQFRPEHFLDAEGNLRKNVQGFFPFSTGKRICIGESLARLELFLFVASIFRTFDFHLCSEPTPSLSGSPDSGIVRLPSPYKVRLELRMNL
uniref:CYP3681A1 n=1 Tax=Diaphanosoma celebensis TaxID=2184134 RepID=A0A896SZF4_9CRUS|nr:CYP3681A1 [Diaphanosoma celebensis]QST15080.1 CYP370C11 protein [Diaphanosoma celebensis]